MRSFIKAHRTALALAMAMIPGFAGAASVSCAYGNTLVFFIRADARLKDKSGRTPIDYARRNEALKGSASLFKRRK